MTYRTSRTIPAPPSSVFSAFQDSARLAVWWGPDGFTSTFDTFEFRPDGKWLFLMHGPDGRSYPNEIVVKEIDAPGRIVLHHVSQPRYLATVTLEATADGGTLVGWNQEFENPETGRKLESIIVPSNEQLMDRLSAEACRLRD